MGPVTINGSVARECFIRATVVLLHLFRLAMSLCSSSVDDEVAKLRLRFRQCEETHSTTQDKKT